MNEIELSKSLKKDALYLFNEGIKVIKPETLIKDHFFIEKDKLTISDVFSNTKKFYLDEFERIFVIGAGKASAAMGSQIEKVLNDKIESGIIVTKYGFNTNLKIIKQIEAGHPLPDENGITAADKIKKLCKSAGVKDLIINLISGGASSLLPSPAKGISLEEKIKTTELLLNCGATIDEINTVRKHISTIKGGQLMQLAYPATVISLIISDVIDDDIDIIGSGLTAPDNSTFSDCLKILTKYKLVDSVPSSVLRYLTEGSNKKKYETPSEENPIFSKANNIIIGNNTICLNHIKNMAINLGYDSKILSTQLSGKAKQVGINITTDAIKYFEHGAEIGKKYCLIYGGETTVHIVGTGKGGRNQELVLSAAINIDGIKGVSLLSGGTDGNDGPTDAAGAYCDWTTIERAKTLNVDAYKYLKNNDSYSFFKKLDDLIITGPTRTNVMDIQIILISRN